MDTNVLVLSVALALCACLVVVGYVVHRRYLLALRNEVEKRTEELSHTTVQMTAAKERAEIASRIKGDFLSSMSHELRTPLNSILGLATLLEEASLPPRERELAAGVMAASESLLDIINSIFDFTQIQAGSLVLKPKEFEACELLDQVCDFHRRQAEQKGLAFVSHINTIGPLWLFADAQRLRQILANLLGNAVKFTSEGRIVFTVEGRRIDRETLLLRLAIEDSGIGIDADQIGTIFEKFNQADTSDTRRYGGTGLGLSISHHLAKLLGSRIQVESVKGTGSTFSLELRLPIAPRSQIGAAPAAEASPKQLLIVEDQMGNRTLMTLLLQKLGYSKIDAAENGVEAVESVRLRHYDAIFMDCQMPEMDGFEATGHIRSLEASRGGHSIIIAVTADAIKSTADKCLAAGMDDCMNKPIRKAEFEACLQKWALL